MRVEALPPGSSLPRDEQADRRTARSRAPAREVNDLRANASTLGAARAVPSIDAQRQQMFCSVTSLPRSARGRATLTTLKP
jgi:hypothetical protein